MDYLEDVNGEYYKIASGIREIYDALEGGIAVVALQKAGNQTFGRGGEATSEKARLYLTLDKMAESERGVICALKIVKAKDYPGPNPNGKEVHVKITRQGIVLLNKWQWLTPNNATPLPLNIALVCRDGGFNDDP